MIAVSDSLWSGRGTTNASRFCCLIVVCLLVGLFTGSSAIAQDNGTTHLCGTQQVYEQKYLAKHGRAPEACDPNGPCDDPSIRDQSSTVFGTDYIVRLMIHIVADDDGTNPFCDSALIWEQMERLNFDYSSTGIQFTAEINHINNSEFRILDENEIFDMKSSTAIAPDSFLNVWPTQVSFSYSFGTFPWDPDVLTNQGGIVMGAFHWLPEANSVFAHEVGHCLGLWHTFHGVDEVSECGACYEYKGAPAAEGDVLGDFCSDTPPTPQNTSCQDVLTDDPCTDLPWAPTMPENYMGYAPEQCLSIFTPQQASRMRCWVVQLDGWLHPFTTIASNTFGEVPLDVTVGVGSHWESPIWSWDFGDGGSSNEDTVIHTYNLPGVRTVSVELNSPRGTYSETYPDLVYAYADTIWVDSVAITSAGLVEVDVHVHNYLPLTQITIPVTWAGSMDLEYFGYVKNGLRSEFMTGTQLNYSAALKRVALRLTAPATNPLLPGDGPVLRLRFNVGSTTPGESNSVAFTTWSSYVADFATLVGGYPAEVRDGAILVQDGCCVGAVGNIDGSIDDAVTLADLSRMIDYLFVSLVPPDCLVEADLDFSGQPDPIPSNITVADLTLLIDHLYISLDPLPPCP